MCMKIALYSLFGQPELCLIFILGENKDFRSGVLLKMPPSSPSMEEFDLDTKAVVPGCSVKKVFLEISQNSQENTCARVSFLMKFQPSALQLY